MRIMATIVGGVTVIAAIAAVAILGPQQHDLNSGPTSMPNDLSSLLNEIEREHVTEGWVSEFGVTPHPDWRKIEPCVRRNLPLLRTVYWQHDDRVRANVLYALRKNADSHIEFFLLAADQYNTGVNREEERGMAYREAMIFLVEKSDAPSECSTIDSAKYAAAIQQSRERELVFDLLHDPSAFEWNGVRFVRR